MVPARMEIKIVGNKVVESWSVLYENMFVL